MKANRIVLTTALVLAAGGAWADDDCEIAVGQWQPRAAVLPPGNADSGKTRDDDHYHEHDRTRSRTRAPATASAEAGTSTGTGAVERTRD